MIYTSMTQKALKLCFDAHRNQVDKTGMPYVFHPFHLAEQMTDELSVTCALLHDVLEDTALTAEDLRAMGFSEAVLEVLALLTHAPGVPYMDYVRALSAHPVARAVKLADLAHNSDRSRMDASEIDDRALARWEKYRAAMEYLKSVEVEG